LNFMVTEFVKLSCLAVWNISVVLFQVCRPPHCFQLAMTVSCRNFPGVLQSMNYLMAAADYP
jgi:hypothetical protein